MRKSKIAKAALLASSLLVATSSFAASPFWTAGSFSLDNPSKSGVKKGDVIEIRLLLTTGYSQLKAIGGLCDFNKQIVNSSQERGVMHTYCVYSGVRPIKQPKK